MWELQWEELDGEGEAVNELLAVGWEPFAVTDVWHPMVEEIKTYVYLRRRKTE